MNRTPVTIKLTHPSDPDLQRKAEWFSVQPGLDLVDSNGSRDTPLLHISRNGVFLESAGTKISFHPSMALLRAIQIGRGETDRFSDAVALTEGDIFLDATLGLATDALIAALQVGTTGTVLGIERTPLLAALMKDGLTTLGSFKMAKVANPEKADAWRVLALVSKRIKVECGDHYELLKSYATRSADVIYFDPMFRHTCETSSSIRPLHQFSFSAPLRLEAVQEALRVARKRVVLKERQGSPEFSRLGFTLLEGGKYSNVAYGVIEV